MPRTGRDLALAAGLALAFGCRGSGTSETANTSREVPVDAPILEWSVDPDPLIEIGDVDDEVKGLYRVAGALRLADGILVLNAGSHEVRMYSESGELLHRLGRQGNGPGEFQRPALIGRLEADSAVVYDMELRRITVVCDGVIVCSEWTIPQVAGRPRGIDSAWVLLEDNSGPDINATDLTASPVTYSLLSRIDSTRHDIASISGIHFLKSREGRGVYFTQVPLERPPLTLLSRGGVILNDGHNNVIRLLDTEGTEVTRHNLPIRDSLVGDSEFENAIASNLASAAPSERRRLEGVYASMSAPKYFPSIRRLLKDEIGLLWVEVNPHVVGPYREWLVVDLRTGQEGYLRTPDGLQVTEIGENYVLGIWRDSLGVEYVRVHTLNRAGGLTRAS